MTPTANNEGGRGGGGETTGAASDQQISAMDWRLEHFLPAPFCNIYSLHVLDDIFMPPPNFDEKTDDSAFSPKRPFPSKGVFVCDINGWFRGWLIETNNNFDGENEGNSEAEKEIVRLNLTEAVFAATPETPESVAQKQQLEIVSTDLRLWRQRLWLATCWVEYGGGGTGAGGGGCPHHHGVSSSHSPSSTTPLVPHRFFTALFRMSLPTPEGGREEGDQIKIEKVDVFEQPGGVPTLTRFLPPISATTNGGDYGDERGDPSALHWLTFSCGGGGGPSGVPGGGGCWRDREEEMLMGAGVDGGGSVGGSGGAGGGIHALTIEFFGGDESGAKDQKKSFPGNDASFHVRSAHRRELPPAIAGFLLLSSSPDDSGENNEGAEWFFPPGASVTRFLQFSYGKEEDDEGVVCFLLGFDNGTVMACTATDRKMLKLNAPISVLTVLDHRTHQEDSENNDANNSILFVRLLVSSTLGPLSVWCLRLATTTTKTTKIDDGKAVEKISLRWDPERCVALLADSDLHDAVTSCCVAGPSPISKCPLVFAGTYGEQLLVYSAFNVDFEGKNCSVTENSGGARPRRLPALIPVRQKVHVSSPILSIVPLTVEESKNKGREWEMEMTNAKNSMLVAVLSYRGVHLYRVAPV